MRGAVLTAWLPRASQFDTHDRCSCNVTVLPTTFPSRCGVKKASEEDTPANTAPMIPAGALILRV